jgi:protein-L-isoaspartate(D-aspartate) O-methyltransferase
MTDTTNLSREDRAAELRAALVDNLRDGVVRKPLTLSPSIEAALTTVPRHLFCPPGTTLEAAYADDIVRTRTDAITGRTTSSVSAPWLQARMLQQAGIEPGMRVAEFGSGGYQAALIAELVGPTGHVVTVDIDSAVVEATQAGLADAGYDTRVTAILGDAAEPLGQGVFDRILVTMGVWDIAPAWLDQLAPDGVLVAPLRVRHPNECWSIEFRRREDLLVGESAFVCGFVDVQGIGAQHPLQATVMIGDDAPVTVLSWDRATDLTDLPAAFDQATSVRVGSGVVLHPPNGMFVGMRTHLACTLPTLVEITWDQGRLVHKADDEAWTTFAHVDNDSLAIAAYWPNPHGDGHELGARGFGPRAELAAMTLAEHIAEWGRQGTPQRAAHVYRVPGGMSQLDGAVLPLPSGGHLAITQHHDGAEEI